LDLRGEKPEPKKKKREAKPAIKKPPQTGKREKGTEKTKKTKKTGRKKIKKG